MTLKTSFDLKVYHKTMTVFVRKKPGAKGWLSCHKFQIRKKLKKYFKIQTLICWIAFSTFSFNFMTSLLNLSLSFFRADTEKNVPHNDQLFWSSFFASSDTGNLGVLVITGMRRPAELQNLALKGRCPLSRNAF